jgi:recombination protein RecA
MMKKKEKKADKNIVMQEGVSILDNTLKAIQTKFGEGSIMKLGDAPKVSVNAISTGSLGLDMALGIGGVPRGRIIEIFGPESSGKTTLSLHIVAEAQKMGGVCAYIDAEHAMDPEYTKKLGVNTKELLISQPDHGEQALEIVESLVRTGKIDVIVVDSVAALTPKDEIEGDMGAHHVGKQARLMSQALRKLTALVAKSKTVVIFINQIRMQIGVMFGNPETTPGGKALKFYTSVRMDIRRIAQIKKGEEVVGGRTRVINRQTGVTTTVPRGNAVQYQTAMEARLRTRTPDATFKMPQIDFYVECVPGKIVSETGNTTQTDPNVSILKIHVFDRQATPYDTQAGLLAATRDDVLNTIGSLPQQVQDGEEGIRESYRATVSSILNLAGNLIRPVQSNSEMTNGRSYRINGGQQEIKNFVMSTMPYMLYGIQGSGIIGAANLSSMQNPALSTVNMLRSFQAGPFRANGEQPGGLPLSIIPCELSLETYGCPLIDFSQQFFMDFGTGTTADNIYAVVGLSHKIEPGNFQSSVKFTPLDAYGKYTPLIDRLNIAAARLADNNNSTRSSS